MRLKIAAAFLLLAISARAMERDNNGTSGGGAGSFATVTTSTLTVTGNGSKCFSVNDPTLVVDCNLSQVMVGTGTAVSLEVASPAITVMNNQSVSQSTATITLMSRNGALCPSSGNDCGLGNLDFFSNDLSANASGVRVRISGQVDENAAATNTGAGAINFKTRGAGSAALTSAMYINSAQKVGIGTASPATLLHVSSSGTIPSLILDGSGAALATPYIISSPGTSTMTPVGIFYFASSTTITGSTCTIGGGTVVNFSSYTLAANALTNPGETILEECAYRNSGDAPTSPQETVRFFGLGGNQAAFASTSVNVASQIIIVRARIMLVRTAMAALSFDTWADTTSGNSTVPATTDGGGNLPTAPLDWTASHLLNCSAQENGGGRVNFLWMKISKQ